MKTNYLIAPSYCKQISLGLVLMLTTFIAHADFTMMNKLLKQSPQIGGFDICYSGGCLKQAHAEITIEEWHQVLAVFTPIPPTAEAERHAIATAIGLLESIVGPKTGTDTDRAGTFGNSDFTGQLDCNDEATNTKTYLKLMDSEGLLTFHKIKDLETRNFFFNGWPHTAVVIAENDSQQQFAVDSWFYDNGLPAEVIPLEKWMDGWKPEKTKAR